MQELLLRWSCFVFLMTRLLPTDPEHRKPMEVLKPMRWWVRLREILRWKSREEALKTRGNRKEEESEGFHGLNLTKRCIM